MKKFEGILICTDLDGTLLRNDRSISRENLEAIAYFQREGGYFTFVTGRMPFYAAHLYDAIQPNAPVGCINGGGVYDYKTQQYLWTASLPADVMDLVEAAELGIEGLGIQVNTFDTGCFCKDSPAMQIFRRNKGMPSRECHYREVDEPIAKIVFADEDEAHITRLAELLQAHPRAGEFDFIRSEKTLYEILPKGIHKGVPLTKLTELLGLDISRTVAIGDYNNDIGMLRAAGVGIAVANAVPEVLEVADHITVSNEEHAIARIISDLEDGVLQFPCS